FSLLHDPSTTDLSPLSLHDALPICAGLEICTDICPSAPYIMVPTGDLPIGNVLSAPFVGISIYDNRVQVPISSFLIVVISGLLLDRKSTRLNSSHVKISYAVFCLKK